MSLKKTPKKKNPKELRSQDLQTYTQVTSPQLSYHLGKGYVPLNKLHCVHIKDPATQLRTSRTVTIGLNNLEQYFTTMYTTSFPSHTP